MCTLRQWCQPALLLSLFGFAVPLYAQSTFELIPFVAYYRPTGSFGPTVETATWLPTTPSDLSAIAWGVEARSWGGGRLGISLKAALATSTMNRQVPPPVGSVAVAGSTDRIAAQILVVTVQAQYDLSPRVGDYHAWIGAGPALVRHGGDVYAAFGPAVDYGGALGVGMDFRVSRQLRATLGAESLLYQLCVVNASSGNTVERGFQIDLLLRAGLSWHGK